MLEEVKLLQQGEENKKMVHLIPKLYEKICLLTDTVFHLCLAIVPNIIMSASANCACFLQTLLNV